MKECANKTMDHGQEKNALKVVKETKESRRAQAGTPPEKAASTTSPSEHPALPAPPAKSRTQKLRLVAEIALTGLRHSALSPEDRADFYEGLGAILSPPASDAARYAATCIRESQGAQRELRAAIEARRGVP